MSILRRLLLAAAFACVVCAPAARADDAAEARQHYNEGTEALRAKHYREAALNFEAATKLRPHGAAAYAAAMAWDKAEQPARAADNYARALDLPGLGPTDAEAARDRLARLERSLAVIHVMGPAELLVQLQGSTEANPPARLHGPPGINTLLVARGSTIERIDVVLKVGEPIDLDVTEPQEAPKAAASASVSAAPVRTVLPPPPPPPPVSNGEQTRKIVGYSALGAGALSAGVAIVLGFKTLSARDEYNDAPSRDRYDSATSLRSWTNVAWASTAVFGGLGAALVLWPSPKPAEQPAQVSLSPTPTGVQLQGAF